MWGQQPSLPLPPVYLGTDAFGRSGIFGDSSLRLSRYMWGQPPSAVPAGRSPPDSVPSLTHPPFPTLSDVATRKKVCLAGTSGEPGPWIPSTPTWHTTLLRLKGYLIVPLTAQTKRDPQYMRVPKLLIALDCLSSACFYGSVTTQFPGVTSVTAVMGCVRVPSEATSSGPICATTPLLVSTLLYTSRFAPDWSNCPC